MLLRALLSDWLSCDDVMWCGGTGNSLTDDISCLAADRMLVFAAAGKNIKAFARNKEVENSGSVDLVCVLH